MKLLLKGFAVLLLVGFVLAGLSAAWFLRWDEIEPPELPGQFERGSLQLGGLERTWQSYIPANLPASPALVLLLHGSRGDGNFMRASTFYGFDVLAEREGFIAVYPDGFERHWNDCRGSANYSANTRNIDDVEFLRILVKELARHHRVDRSRVYVAGISNGGQMAYRLAMESPELVAGIAAIAANLPVNDNLGCEPTGVGVATLVINGTDDPVNPYGGGTVEIFGDTSRGEVRSAESTAAYWASVAGYQGPGMERRWPDRNPDDGTAVKSLSWSSPPNPTVQLLTVEGGGHTTPHPVFNLPRIVGTTSHEFDGAEVIWSFFSSGVPVTP